MSTKINSKKDFGNNEKNILNNKENLIKSFLYSYKIIIFVIINIIFSIGILIKNYKENLKLLDLKVKMKEDEMHYLKKKKKSKNTFNYMHYHQVLKKEKDMPHLREIISKRTFDNRYPLPKEINCKPHLKKEELVGFLSLLTEDTIYFETGSGCSSIIAKYFAKKTYAVEGCKGFYELGLKNGLQNILIFKNLKPDNPTWSFPGKKSNLDDWKQYFQAYKAEYNADVILIDGRFKVATAMDIFNKIKNNTIVLLHEYYSRPQYFIIENYYEYIYHWGSLYAFAKKKNIQYIPLEIQKKYWNDFS